MGCHNIYNHSGFWSRFMGFAIAFVSYQEVSSKETDTSPKTSRKQKKLMDILSTHCDGHKAHFAMAIFPHFASAQMVWGSWWSIQWHYAILRIFSWSFSMPQGATVQPLCEIVDWFTRWWFETLFIYTPGQGRWSKLTSMFQMSGWNHQLVHIYPPGN